MKPKQTNLSKYMNFTKKNKSTKKGKHKTVIPNFLDSTSHKYSNYLQSSLKEEDIFLLKRKLKNYSKMHSNSSNNTNKNNESNKNNNKMPMSSYINYMSPGNNYLSKKKKENVYIDKSAKNHLMLTSMNNSSIMQSSKEKVLSYSINNISNYQSNQNNLNNILCNNNGKKPLRGNNNTNNSIYKKCSNENDVYNQKNNVNKKEINIIKKMNKDKKYSLTSINSRKNSTDKEDVDIVKKLHKLNFDGLFKNINKKIIYSSKNSAKNINSTNLNNNKKLHLGDFFNLKKKGKYPNNFLEVYFKAPQSSNNRKIKKYINNNSNIHHKSMSNNNNQNPITNNTLSPNNNFSSSNNSPINNNKFFKTAKVSPRTSFPKKKQELQSHRVNMKNKISGNIMAFYNNYKKNNINANNCLLYGNSYNLDSNSNYANNNKTNSQISKKPNKKINMSVNMNINSNNNNNFNMSNIKNNKNNNNNHIISNNNFPKCSSLNKIKKNNFIINYNLNGNNNAYNNNNINNNNNNNYINKKTINPIMNNNNKKYNNENQMNNCNNFISNCQININNINYNNYNQNLVQKNNHIMNDKIINLFKKKNLIDISSSKINKIFSQSQQEIVQTKKTDIKNFTSNNSPINKNRICMKINNKITYKDKENLSSNLNKIVKNSINTKEIQKPKIKSKNSKEKDNNINNNNINNNNSNENIKVNVNKKKLNKDEDIKNENIQNNQKEIKNNSKNEIQKLKQNLQKNNSDNIINSKTKPIEANNHIIENKNINTISCISSTTRDSNYYMEKCNSLSKYIKEYYNKNQKYPSTDLNFYLYGRLIGQGAFGKVNIGLNVLTGRVVAIKSFNKKDLNKNGENMKKILYETNLMKKLNHPNITKILEMFEDDDYILISMEYINGGNLFSFVKKRRKLSEKTAKFLFKQIILGIKHMHSNKIVHRDIKLENILIDLNNNVKICDFGIGRILTSNKQLLHDKCGTPMYMAPEILLSSKNQGYEGFPVDIWSSGISLYIMLSGTLPFNLKNNESSSIEEESGNNIELQNSIINKEPKHIEKISDEARDLLKGLLNKNPNKRLTIDKILNHPWLKNDEKKIKSNKKYHLFTKAEMIMLSKTYIDYRNGAIDNLKENFTISNLKINTKDGAENKMKNISTKSSLLAPYNTLIQDDESLSYYDLKDSFDDLTNTNINLENDILVINNKVKEYNLNYELNNNGECDNGMIINSKTGTLTSSVNNSNQKNDGQLTNRSRQRNNEDDNDMLDEINENEEQEEEQETKINKILDEIEKIGYDKEYVLNCVNKNILCHASTIFYLMLNYKNI